LSERFIGAAACGVILGVFYTALSSMIAPSEAFSVTDAAVSCAWRIFIFSILAPVGAIITELKLPNPDL
jgi:hypothetical protein